MARGTALCARGTLLLLLASFVFLRGVLTPVLPPLRLVPVLLNLSSASFTN
jgi:hypothetical protein